MLPATAVHYSGLNVISDFLTYPHSDQCSGLPTARPCVNHAQSCCSPTDREHSAPYRIYAFAQVHLESRPHVVLQGSRAVGLWGCGALDLWGL